MLALVAGCATTSASNLGAEVGLLPADVDEGVLEGGAVAEATLALAQVWSVASGVREEGARLSFTFWSERGALTLTGYEARRRSGPPGEPVDDEAFQEELARIITRFAQWQTGTVALTLERQQARWTMAYSTSAAPRPQEAKTLPVRRAGLSAETVESVTSGVEQVLRPVEVPAGGEAQVDLECSLEDGRAEEWRLRLFEVTRGGTGGAARAPASSVRGEAASVLMPFTQGLGERTIRLRLRLSVPPGARQSIGWVEAAEVERPAPPAELDAAFIAEYRAMHEDILRRWREETEEGAKWVARKGAEELAVWFAGGIVTRGLGLLGGRVAPTVVRALKRSGTAASGWLRTTLTRLAPQERMAFERLWTKLQLEGKGALSGAERAELRELMAGIERLIREPLDRETKIKLRAQARQAYKALHPELSTLLDKQGVLLPIHHRCPLEYAHLFPERNINAAENLAMVTQNVHKRIDALWTKFRRSRPAATAEEVEAASHVIDGRFGPWYHHTAEPRQVSYSLKEAEETALAQLQRLFPGLQ
jgi:hypothetical protein